MAFESPVTVMARPWHPWCTCVCGGHDSAGLGLAQAIVDDIGAPWSCNEGHVSVTNSVVRILMPVSSEA